MSIEKAFEDAVERVQEETELSKRTKVLLAKKKRLQRKTRHRVVPKSLR
jgi:hypothetical protein